MVQEVDEQTLDMRTIVILKVVFYISRRTDTPHLLTHLIRHNHQPPVPQAPHIRINLVMLEPHNLLHILNLLILHDRIVLRFAHVERFSAEGEDTEVVATDNS